jgi:hypothetical protein
MDFTVRITPVLLIKLASGVPAFNRSYNLHTGRGNESSLEINAVSTANTGNSAAV